MKTTLKNNTLTICLEGRIDTNNAQATEAELIAAVDANPGAETVIDAAELEYISSAGLRALMKLRKKVGKTLPVLNVSSEVYEIFEVTGFTELLDVHKRMRELSVEGCELIGSGGFGKVYRIDPETIVKVYSPTITLDMVQHERDTAQKAFLAGVPTAISYDVVRCGDCYGVVFELLNAKTVAQIMDEDPSRVPEMGRKSAQLLKELHQIEIAAGALPDRKEEFLSWLPNVEPVLESAEAETILRFIQSLPERGTFLHGDFNSKNIMVQEDGEFILIDIGDAAVGHPVFDVASLILPYLFLPKSPLPEEERRRLMGFRLEDGPRMWDAMCREYFGVDSPAEVEGITGKTMAYAQLLASYQGTRRCGYDLDYMNRVSVVGIRQRLLPLISSAKPMDW